MYLVSDHAPDKPTADPPEESPEDPAGNRAEAVARTGTAGRAEADGRAGTAGRAEAATQELAARLIVHGSGFARTASRGTTRGFSLVGLRVLSNLQKEGGLRVGELAQLEGITQPSMTTAVNGLEKAGLVVRAPDPADARASTVSLTPAGTAELADFRSRTAEAVSPVLAELPDGDRALLERAAGLLERLTGRLRET